MAWRFTRRELLKRAVIVAGAAAGGKYFPSPVLLAEQSPNSKLACVVIGCGGRSTQHLVTAANEKLVAVVDPDETRIAKAFTFLEKGSVKFKIADFKRSAVKTFIDYRKLFDEMGKSIDAVFVATPNHHHALPALIAMTLGKGVYVEKPLTHTIAEARQMAEFSKKYKVPTQMGNQGHCGEGYRRLCEYIWAGAIGNVTEVHCWADRANGGVGPRPPTEPIPAGMHWDEWIGPSKYRDYHKDLHPHEWHGWYDFGNGSLGNMACHIMDGAVWSLKLKWPTSVTCEEINGGTDERYPIGCRIRYDFPAREKLPPVKMYWWDGKKKGAAEAKDENGEPLPVLDGGLGKAEKTLGKAQQNRPPVVLELEKKYGRNLGGCGTIYIGDKGIMYTSTYGDGVSFLPTELKDTVPVPEKTIPRVKGSFEDFVHACHTGTPSTCANFEYAAGFTEIVLLGNLAQKAGPGKSVLWDGPNMKCTNIPEVNALVANENRKGWTI